VKNSARALQLTAINFVADAVNRSLDLKEIADNALHAILSVMPLDAGALYIRPPPAAGLSLFAARGLTAAAPGATELEWNAAGFATVLAVPVPQGEALLVLAARGARPVTAADRELVEVIANQIGHAMTHARLTADLREKNKTLEVLIEEAHHRIKNNLQMISGLLQIQLDEAGPAAAALRTAMARIQAIAHVHNLLSAEWPDQVDACKLIRAVVGAEAPVTLDLRPLWLAADQAVAVALIVNELVTNARQHARPARGALRIRVACGRAGNDGVVEVADNGAGPAPSAAPTDGQGINIVRQLARVNLRGRLTLTGNNPGWRGRLQFPVTP
jgi:two-component sensor histidine kinase